MIRAIVRNALRFRGLMVGIAAAVIVLGVVMLKDAPVDVYPEFTPPYVEIQTESLGLSAPEVEQLLTVPLEADLLNGVEGVEVIRSKSLPGLSSITLVFEPGFDVYKGRQLVQERLVQLGGAAFPNVSDPPTMLQPLSSSSRVLMVGLDSGKLSPIERSVIAKWTVRPRLHGRAGRRQRLRVGHARPAAPGPGRYQEARRPQRVFGGGSPACTPRSPRACARTPQGSSRRCSTSGHDEMVHGPRHPQWRRACASTTSIPCVGKAHVAYIPNERRVGCHRAVEAGPAPGRAVPGGPQVQERLTAQIADAHGRARLEPRGALVVIEAEHLCMSHARGPQARRGHRSPRPSAGSFRDSVSDPRRGHEPPRRHPPRLNPGLGRLSK